jgi:hypothetical protein
LAKTSHERHQLSPLDIRRHILIAQGHGDLQDVEGFGVGLVRHRFRGPPA